MESLFTSRNHVWVHISWIKGEDNEFVLAIVEIVRDIKGECSEASTVKSRCSAIDEDSGLVIDGSKVENYTVTGPFGRHLERSSIPRIDSILALNTRQTTFQAERHQDFLGQRLIERRDAEITHARRAGVCPDTIQALPLRSGQFWPGVLRPWVRTHLIRPVCV